MESLSQNHEENIDRFVAEIIATGLVWGLEGDDGWALCPSEENSELDVMPFWSQEAFAKLHCAGEWSVFQPVAISLEEFLDEWLPGLHQDVLMVGANWNAELEGYELEPLDLLEDIEGQLP